MVRHFETVSRFYNNLQTARLRWCNYIGSQYAIEKAVNIVINGSKKYNKTRKARTKKNKRKKGNAQGNTSTHKKLVLFLFKTFFEGATRTKCHQLSLVMV